MRKIIEKQLPKNYMEEALKEAYEGIHQREGGPFGCVIVKDGVIVGRGHNQVLKNRDCTCHGEMQAIRAACRKLGTHDLAGCELYTTAEPCPMCLGAVLWANIRQVYYGCRRKDTDSIGFRDEIFYDCFYGKDEQFQMKEIEREACLQLFEEYRSEEGQERY